MYLVYKYNQFKRQQQESNKRKLAEKELNNLNQKIDKLLARLDEQSEEQELSRDLESTVDADLLNKASPVKHRRASLSIGCTNDRNGGGVLAQKSIVIPEDDECVVCLSAKATMQTFPCGHKVVCRKCFVKTIQVAVTQRCLPLRCVVCRARILKLKQSSISQPGKSSVVPNTKGPGTPKSIASKGGTPKNTSAKEKAIVAARQLVEARTLSSPRVSRSKESKDTVNHNHNHNKAATKQHAAMMKQAEIVAHGMAKKGFYVPPRDTKQTPADSSPKPSKHMQHTPRTRRMLSKQ